MDKGKGQQEELTYAQLLKKLQKAEASLASEKEKRQQLSKEKKELTKEKKQLIKQTEFLRKEMQVKDQKHEEELQKVLENAISDTNLDSERLKTIKRILELFADDHFRNEYDKQTSISAKLLFMLEYIVKLLSNNRKLKKFLFGNGPGNPKKGSEALKKELEQAGNEKKEQEKEVADSANKLSRDQKLARRIKSISTELTNITKEIATGEHAPSKGLTVRGTVNSLARAVIGNETDAVHSSSEPPPKQESKGSKVRTNPLPWRDDPQLPEGASFSEAAGKALESATCPNCGGRRLEPIKTIIKTLLDTVTAIGMMEEHNGAYNFKTAKVIYQCKDCGFSGELEVGSRALSPQSSITLRSIAEIALVVTQGLDIRNAEQLLLPQAGLGNTTIYNQLQLFSYYFTSLADTLSATVDKQQCAHFDETTWVQIDSPQGRHKTYMCFKCCAHDSPTPAVVFGVPGSRSGVDEYVDGFINALKEGEVKCAVTDCYVVYRLKFVKNGIKLQACLAHLQTDVRGVLEQVGYEHLTGLEDHIQECAREIINQGSKALEDPRSAVILLCAVKDKISMVFDHEQAAREAATKSGTVDYTVIQEYRTKYCAPLMDDIHTIFAALAEVYCKCDDKGTYHKSGSLEQIGAVAAYFLNNEKQFRTFLTCPQVPLSNNEAERMAKYVASIRSSGIFTRTQKGGEVYSTLLTVIYSAMLNGITSMGEYLMDVADYVSKTGQNALLISQIDSRKKLRSKLNFNDKKLYANVHIPDWLLPWNWVREHNQSVTRSPSAPAEINHPAAAAE